MGNRTPDLYNAIVMVGSFPVVSEIFHSWFFGLKAWVFDHTLTYPLLLQIAGSCFRVLPQCFRKLI